MSKYRQTKDWGQPLFWLVTILFFLAFSPSALQANDSNFEESNDLNILMSQITLEQLQSLEDNFEKWSQDLILSFKSKSGLLPGIKTHAAPSAEIYFSQQESESFFLWSWLFKKRNRLSTEHLRYVRVYLNREFTKSDQKELFKALILNFHENAFRIYDAFMLENIENLHIAHNDIVQRLMASPSLEFNKFEEHLMLQSYLRIWTLSAIWIYTREALIQEQISQNFWKGDVGQEQNFGTNSVQDCRIAFMDLFKY